MRFSRIANFAGRYAFAAAYAASTLTIGLFSPRRRFVISQLARQARYREYPRPKLPQVDLSDITKEATEVSLPHPIGVEGNVSLLEQLALARLVRERSPRTLFEIGTFNGRTTVTLAENAPQDATVYTLDLPVDGVANHALVAKERVFVEKPAPGELVNRSTAARKVVQLLGDSARFDFNPYEVDLVFIDGSHAFENVMNDSRRAIEMLRTGRGLIVWHDYGEWEGVTRALDSLFAMDGRFTALRHVRETTLAILDRR
jgi:predicted O-methyltransferase YrrM